MPFERYLETDDSQADDLCESGSSPLLQKPYFMQNDPLVFNLAGPAGFLQQSPSAYWATSNSNFLFQDATYHHPSTSFSSFSSLSNALHLPVLSKTTSVLSKEPIPELGLAPSNPYSSSGFDFLPLLARVVNRPNPSVAVGHVDLSCSFVVVDVRRDDTPIVYCSPNFCHLTGYEEREITGRNCRFLQSPLGLLQPGEQRKHTDPEAVAYLHRSLIANKECQTPIINYRKGGAPFTNFLTIIPLPGGVNCLPHEANDYVYHIGFQVDLNEQPQAILQRLPGRNLAVNYTSSSIPPIVPLLFRDRKSRITRIASLSNVLRTLFKDPSFIQSIPMTPSSSVVPSAASLSEKVDDEAQHILNMLLLERSPDFIHVVSLKGYFLYVAPSVRNVLGYEPEELIGKSISEFCHPADLVPLMRELKESSISPQYIPDSRSPTTPSMGMGSITTPRTVDILFRAQSKHNGYIWVECRGRLHVESGKGRKAIILSGRARQMPQLKWLSVAQAGGLIPPPYANRHVSTPETGNQETSSTSDLESVQQEFWGMITCAGTLLVVEPTVRDVLGWEVEELVGKDLVSLCVVPGGNDRLHTLPTALAKVSEPNNGKHVAAKLLLKRKAGYPVPIVLVLYASFDRRPSEVVPSWPLVFQIRLEHPSSDTHIAPLTHSLDSNMFEELEITRGTSWQYELQQLKFTNQRLVQEIRELEEQQQVAHPDSGTKR